MIYRSARCPLEDIGGTVWTVTVDAFLPRTRVVLARLSEVCIGGARRVDAVCPSFQTAAPAHFSAPAAVMLPSKKEMAPGREQRSRILEFWSLLFPST